MKSDLWAAAWREREWGGRGQQIDSLLHFSSALSSRDAERSEIYFCVCRFDLKYVQCTPPSLSLTLSAPLHCSLPTLMAANILCALIIRISSQIVAKSLPHATPELG